MTETKTYGLKGTQRKEAMRDTATLDDFPALESDWRELFRWVLAMSGSMPYFDREDRASGTLSSLWENHVLTVLAEMLRKEIGGYVDSFVEGRGTSAQAHYTDKLQRRFEEWAERVEIFIRQSRSASGDTPSVEVAEQLLDRLRSALPQAREPHRDPFAPIADDPDQSYFRMLGTVKDVQQQADEYIARIESSGHLDAALALLLTFVRNYGDLAARFNRRFGAWAAFYRKRILHDAPKEAVQDSTFVVIEPNRSQAAEPFLLPAGTGFSAGQLADGSDRIYATVGTNLIVPARIHTAYALHREHGALLAVPATNPGDGKGRPLFSAEHPAAAPLEYGWLLASRSLLLSEGRRRVTVRFDLEPADGRPEQSVSAGSAAAFRLQTSGSAGWADRACDWSYDAEKRSLQFRFTLEEGDEAPIACTEALHGIDTEHPALRLLFADRTETELLSGVPINGIRIHTEVENIRHFTLIGESGQADPSQPFYPFGPMGERGSRFLFGHEEAAAKALTAITLEGTWSKLPENGFEPIYRNYDTGYPVGGDSFAVRCEWQDENGWHEFPASPRPLFRRAPDGRIADQAVFTFAYPPQPSSSLRLPYRADRKGFYRMTLTTPDIGFGTSAYYRLFSEVSIHNSRAKKRHRKALPAMPQVPVLLDPTFGYRSEEHFCRETGRLYRFDAAIGYEDCGDLRALPPAFAPDTEAPALIVGLDGTEKTKRLRLYFDLQDAAAEGAPAAERPVGRLRIGRYAGSGRWVELQPDEIPCEETEGLTRSGTIELQIQAPDETNGRWLKFAFDAGSEPQGIVLNGLYLNCIRVQAVGGDGTPLPAGTISAPVRPDRRIGSVRQPQPGYGGKPAETEADADIRQRIRIATRNRAVRIGDYEQLLLERFPEVEKVCCLPVENEAHEIRIVAFPKPVAQRFPFLPAWKRTAMEQAVRRLASPFARIRVVNPAYEPLDVHYKAMLKKGTGDRDGVMHRTERRIRTFLMGWYPNGTLPDLGASYSHKALLSRIENDPCIEKSVFLRIARGGQEREACGEDDRLYRPAKTHGVFYVRTMRVELDAHRSGVGGSHIGTDFIIG